MLELKKGPTSSCSKPCVSTVQRRKLWLQDEQMLLNKYHTLIQRPVKLTVTTPPKSSDNDTVSPKKQSSELFFRQLVWVLLLQTGRIWNKSTVKILPMTSLSRRKSITKCENAIIFHHDKNHHNSLHFPRWFSPFIFVERTGIWVGDHFLESIGKIHIILLAFFDPSKVWSPGPESTR